MARPLPLVGLTEGMPGTGGFRSPGPPRVSPSAGVVAAAGIADIGSAVLSKIDDDEKRETEIAKRVWMAGTAADLENAADRLALEHETDPEAFATVYEATARPYLETAPDDESRALMTVEARRVGEKRATKIVATTMERDDEAEEADLLTARESFEARGYQAFREGDFAMGEDENGQPVMAGAAAEYMDRAEALDVLLVAGGQMTGRQAAEAHSQRQAAALENIVLGEFDRQLANGFDAADAFIAAAARDTETVPDPADRDRLVAKMEARVADGRREVKRRVTAADDARKQAVAATQQAFINRLYRPTSENGGPLSQAEILDSDLPAFGKGSKQTYIGLLDKSPEDIRHTDPKLFTDLYRDIDAGKITDPNLLRTFVGNGIAPPAHNQLRGFILSRNKAAQDPVERRTKDFLATMESRLTGSTQLIRDPDGDERFYSFMVAFDREKRRRVAAGADPMDLMDPTHKDYLGNMPEARKRTATEMLRSRAAAFEAEGALATAPGGPEPGAASAAEPDAEADAEALGEEAADRARRPGETPDQYLKRIGLE